MLKIPTSLGEIYSKCATDGTPKREIVRRIAAFYGVGTPVVWQWLCAVGLSRRYAK